jgi:hypothetical protein
MSLNSMDILHTSVRPRVKYLIARIRRICLGQVMVTYLGSLITKPKLSEQLLLQRGTSLYSVVIKGLRTMFTAAPLH